MTAREKITKFKNNRKIKKISFFLLLSAVFWFFTTLSENYTYLTTYNINYTNIPDNVLFQDLPKSELLTQIDASGFRILNHKLDQKEIDIDVSQFVKKGKYQHFYLPNTQIVQLQKQFHKESIIRFATDSLFLNLGSLKTKKIPVKSNLKLSLKAGYRLKQALQITPDSITVKGPEKFLDSIRFVATNSHTFDFVDKSFVKTINLQFPKYKKNIYYSTEKVEVKAEIAKYTQEQRSFPITIQDLPKGIEMNVFPERAILQYEVSFENYKKIDAMSFQISCKYPTDAIQNSKLKLFLSKKPDFITNYSIQPTHVGYLIERE